MRFIIPQRQVCGNDCGLHDTFLRYRNWVTEKSA